MTRAALARRPSATASVIADVPVDTSGDATNLPTREFAFPTGESERVDDPEIAFMMALDEMPSADLAALHRADVAYVPWSRMTLYQKHVASAVRNREVKLMPRLSHTLDRSMLSKSEWIAAALAMPLILNEIRMADPEMAHCLHVSVRCVRELRAGRRFPNNWMTVRCAVALARRKVAEIGPGEIMPLLRAQRMTQYLGSIAMRVTESYQHIMIGRIRNRIEREKAEAFEAGFAADTCIQLFNLVIAQVTKAKAVQP